MVTVSGKTPLEAQIAADCLAVGCLMLGEAIGLFGIESVRVIAHLLKKHCPSIKEALTK